MINIRRTAKARGVTMRALAAATNIHETHLARVASRGDIANVGLRTAVRLADALGVTLDKLATGRARPVWKDRGTHPLRALARAKGLTQLELARASGVSPQHTSHVINNHRGMTLDVCLKLAVALGVSADPLARACLRWSEKHNPSGIPRRVRVGRHSGGK
jgi:transcriptional regulator with XRE-family HTH domain